VTPQPPDPAPRKRSAKPPARLGLPCLFSYLISRTVEDGSKLPLGCTRAGPIRRTAISIAASLLAALSPMALVSAPAVPAGRSPATKRPSVAIPCWRNWSPSRRLSRAPGPKSCGGSTWRRLCVLVRTQSRDSIKKLKSNHPKNVALPFTFAQPLPRTKQNQWLMPRNLPLP
jgi:hypothetical protein